jgi:DNA polymerase III epsilon subunit-like protein
VTAPAFFDRYRACFDATWTDQTPLDDVRFIVLDSETTGLNPRTDRLITIGAVAVRAGEIVTTLGTGRLLVAAAVILTLCAFLAKWAYSVRPRAVVSTAARVMPSPRAGQKEPSAGGSILPRVLNPSREPLGGHSLSKLISRRNGSPLS